MIASFVISALSEKPNGMLLALSSNATRQLAILLPKLPQPTAVFLLGQLIKLPGIEPDTIATYALIDQYFLKTPLF
jgi:hypothetical protein